ncbi:MAG: sulfatase-like hydrolase/transferase [Planctomycetes bacterium]|nr:sulfatase-like hydrolase/transferase [Planctomycetota bacterium]
MFAALFCTLMVKLFHSLRTGLADEYFSWVFADVAVLLGIEIILAVACFCWPRKRVFRTALIIATITCTWSVMNAGWLIRTGTQILPTVLLPLLRDPLNSLVIIGVSLAKMPIAAVALLGPSAVALAFVFYVLAKPPKLNYRRKFFLVRIFICLLLVTTAILARGTIAKHRSTQIVSTGSRYNCQLRAITFFLYPGPSRLAKTDLANAKRKIPAFDQIQIGPSSKLINHNVILVILEGVQYRYTSLYGKQGDLTPYLASLAKQGVEFTNTRASLSHTTKAIFSLLTGRYPSVSQDLAEVIPVAKPYAGITTILKQKMDFKTAFFQSAKGNFECRPGLAHNLGYDKFWSRDDLSDPNAFLGYLACDEFKMLKPITEWIKADEKPFFLTILCSVTHDPYVVPKSFAIPAKEPIERYRQAISYTDKFIEALDAEIKKLNLTKETIFCVVGDHGEAFGEHGLHGHERIAFDEALHVPFVLRAPSLVKPGSKITLPLSSIDLAPTLLALLGFDTSTVNFDGANALQPLPDDHKAYFSGWMQQSPAGFVKANRKFIYYPTTKSVSAYDLDADQFELFRITLSEQQECEIANEIIAWRKDSIFRPDQKRTGKKMLFDRWLCRWNNRIGLAKYRPKAK